MLRISHGIDGNDRNPDHKKKHLTPNGKHTDRQTDTQKNDSSVSFDFTFEFNGCRTSQSASSQSNRTNNNPKRSGCERKQLIPDAVRSSRGAKNFISGELFGFDKAIPSARLVFFSFLLPLVHKLRSLSVKVKNNFPPFSFLDGGGGGGPAECSSIVDLSPVPSRPVSCSA